jgi:cyclophilin family peptidyl-prolyl cis-trans isomerase
MIRTFVAPALALALGTLLPPWQPVRAQEEVLPATEAVDLVPGSREAEIGELIYRGGIAIAPEGGIGGLSALTWHEGALHAVSDEGRWLTIAPDEMGVRLVGVEAVTLGPLRDAKGGTLDAKTRGDAEALTRRESGEWLVAFEREHRVWRYADLAGPAAGDEPAVAPLLSAIAQANNGIEALAAFPGGLLACGEWVDPARPNCLRITASGAAPVHLAAPDALAAAGGAPTDAACAADGTCYVLFRSYRENEGVRAAILALAPDGTSRPIALFDAPLARDNFEGLALREEPGKTWLYLVSDDNFNNCAAADRPGCQRTLLMKFELKPPPGGARALTPADFARTPTGRPATRPYPDAASVTVVLETTLGPVTIALETARAPVTAGNFLRYVEDKRLDGTAFYRAMDLPGARLPSGLVQGGTRGDPARVLPPIAHEPTGTTGLGHVHGAVSMAVNGPGTANGDFFVMIEDQPGFDADPAASDPAWRNGYAVFGHVTAGMEVIAAIHAAARDSEAGEGVMKGQMLGEPVRILSARRLDPAPAP